MSTTAKAPARVANFIRDIMAEDLQSGWVEEVVTRFPPEPNGYLHIGHAKSICLNFGLAERFQGRCHLRFDDTNPTREEQEYVDAIKADVSWLGFEWSGSVRYASDYFDQFYAWAQELIKAGKAYVCDLDAETASNYRGWATQPGRPSPYRERSVEENLRLLEGMKAGEFEEGSRVLRARIDMASPNMNLRDPILYRIRKQSHHQTGDRWCIYPSYDFAHGQEDAIEGVTHSICTLEFADHRPLYDWFIGNLSVPSKPRQYEFGRLNLNYTVTSKRRLRQLVDEGYVDGWDDPRMPTLIGMRRRGFTPTAIRSFCDALPVSRSDGVVDMAQLESAVRDDLDKHAPRAFCVLDPVKLVLEDMAEDTTEWLQLPAHPKVDLGTRRVPLTRELYIDRADFSEDQGLSRKKFKRLVLGDYVRLRGAQVIRAEAVEHDAEGRPSLIRARRVPGTLGANPPEGVRPRGVIHWVSASLGVRARVRLYDRLFLVPNPGTGDQPLAEALNPDSLRVLEECWVEPGLARAAPEACFQFEREGYFVADIREHSPQAPVFNRTLELRDRWSGRS